MSPYLLADRSPGISSTSVVIGSALVATAWYLYTGYANDDRMPTDFDSYLADREYKATSNNKVTETDFENWIRKPDPASTTYRFSSTETSDSEDHQLEVPVHLKPVGVLYGTEFGLSREVCEKLCDKLNATNKYYPMLLSMDDFPGGLDLAKFQTLAVACSTQGEGVPPTDARPFCQWLQSDKAPTVPNLKFSVCALGDTSYTHFAQCGKDLDARLGQLAGPSNRLAPRVDVNKEDWSAIDGWIDSVLTGLDALDLSTIEELDDSFVGAATVGATGAAATGVASFSKSRPYMAEIISVSSLCSITGADDKNTIRVDIDLGDSGLGYQPGDSLGVWPQNNPNAVAEIVELMGWDADEPLPRPTWHYKTPTDPTDAGKNAKMSLRDLLTTCYDLRTPKPDLLEYLMSSVGARTDIDDRAAYLEKRHVIDILRDFFSADASGAVSAAHGQPAAILKYLRQLVPRLYSISSSPLDDPTKVTLTVAVVGYEQLGVERQGVCSTYLHDRVLPGSKIPVYVYDNPDFRLPDASSTPIIMVGPGTGVAPFRSFLRHRALTAKDSTMRASDNVLFFGSRRHDQDFLYGDEFETMDNQGKLHLITAFSREQTSKVYVQDRIKEHADLIWNALENNGHFYICGDGEHMSRAVESALESLIAERIGRKDDQEVQLSAVNDAKNYVANLVASSRFQTDVWF
jgi:sulfite reductase (NADPH) flavoprotein alpha-component